ncbi:Murein hydrolase activator EnvC [hydrothermal vent metagenome]|uniref:Murein hydrolase activator EnvC n=1 Tax=hydrothermal vent metagenome TaxID=652676 RepID=A0A3B0URG7_9ZZZZ
MCKALTFLLILLPWSIASQESEIQLETKIVNIQQKLNLLKTKLNKAHGQAQVLITKLEQQDLAIATISKQVVTSNLQLTDIKARVADLTSQIATSSNSIEQQQGQIINLLKLQVYISHDKTLKMLLASPKNTSNIQTKHQIKYLQNRLYNLIKRVAQQIKSLEVLKSNQISLQQQEDLRQQDLITQQGELLEHRKQRLKILNQLKIEIANHETESESLTKDQTRLRQLLDEIRHLLSDLPKDLGTHKSFGKLKGKMKKPVAGKYIRSFRSRRSANTRWNGVVIKPSLDTKVHAIAYGRVAFADWLRGFGMLVILDHQDGYMSLYGFNESINVEVGDWVKPRQQIATIGNSGTLTTPAVYFEIRKDAMPLNPKSWVK